MTPLLRSGLMRRDEGEAAGEQQDVGVEPRLRAGSSRRRQPKRTSPRATVSWPSAVVTNSMPTSARRLGDAERGPERPARSGSGDRRRQVAMPSGSIDDHDDEVGDPQSASGRAHQDEQAGEEGDEQLDGAEDVVRRGRRSARRCRG